MRIAKQSNELLSQLSEGRVYSWSELKEYSNSPGRHVKRLLDKGLLNKVGPGLYSPPKKSRFGVVPPKEDELVKNFLKSEDFLLFSTNLYNSLDLGLTQLKNETVVYNKKRYEPVELAGRKYDFKRPNNGYPNKLTVEFLVVDLMNNLKSVGEDSTKLKDNVNKAVRSSKFNKELLLDLANRYGKVGTKKFFSQFADESNSITGELLLKNNSSNMKNKKAS